MDCSDLSRLIIKHYTFNITHLIKHFTFNIKHYFEISYPCALR